MPLINSGAITPGAPFPQALYGPGGVLVVVPTAADAAAAVQAGFSSSPDPAYDWGSLTAPSGATGSAQFGPGPDPQRLIPSYPQFNYIFVGVANHPANYGTW